MKRVILIIALGVIATAAAIALAKRCTRDDESERAGFGAPMERAEPQARAS